MPLEDRAGDDERAGRARPASAPLSTSMQSGPFAGAEVAAGPGRRARVAGRRRRADAERVDRLVDDVLRQHPDLRPAASIRVLNDAFHIVARHADHSHVAEIDQPPALKPR